MEDKTFDKYKLVIDEWFVNGWNGTQSYLKFYPDAEYNTADKGFRDIHEIPRIQDYIKEKKKKAQITLQTSHEKLLEELSNWAYSDITETLMLSPEQVKELPIEIRRLITKFKTTTRTFLNDETPITETVVELWFVSKEKAMEMIHKHTGFYEKDNNQKSVTIDLVDYSKLSTQALQEIENASKDKPQ